MDWNVVFAIVALAALFQLAFFWYYLKSGQRRDSVYPSATGESSDNTTVPQGNQRASGHPTGGTDPVLTCSECGYENEWDPTFSFCANCASQISR